MKSLVFVSSRIINQIKRVCLLNDCRQVGVLIENSNRKVNSLTRFLSEMGKSAHESSFHTMISRSSRNGMLPHTICSRQSLYLNMVNTSANKAPSERPVAVSQDFNIRKADGRQYSKTIVIIFGFYGAPESAVRKYCHLYHSYGYDAIFVHSYLKHFVWPKNSLGLAKGLLDFVIMNCSKYENIVIHAFSMGAYNFTLCLSEMYRVPKRYSSIEKRINAVVFDSLTIGTLKHMAEGVGQGLSRNGLIQKVVPLSMSLYFKLTNKYTVRVYEHYISLFKQKPLQVPTLVFYSKNDPMSDFHDVEAMIDDWKKHFHFKVTSKYWDISKHSAHLLTHKEDYTHTLDSFLKSVPGLMKIDSKI